MALPVNTSFNSFGAQPFGNATADGSANDFFNLIDVTLVAVLNNPAAMPISNIEKLFKVEDVRKGEGKFKYLSSASSEPFSKLKGEGQNPSKLKWGTGYKKVVSPNRFALEFDFTWEADNYNKHTEAIASITSMGTQCLNRYFLDLSHVIGFGDQPNYINQEGKLIDLRTGDGNPLFFATHTIPFSDATYSNIYPPTQFSQTALEGMENLKNINILDDFGVKANQNYIFDILWFSDDSRTLNEVMRVLNSTSSLALNQNAGVDNVYGMARGTLLPQYTPLLCTYIATDAFGSPNQNKRGYWGIAATGGGISNPNSLPAYAYIWERPRSLSPSNYPSLINAHTDVVTWGVRMTWGTAIRDARGIIGCLFNG